LLEKENFGTHPSPSRHYITTTQNKVLSPEERGEVTTQNGYGETKGVYCTKGSIYLLKILHTFARALKAAAVDGNESLSMNPPRNMMCIRLVVRGLPLM
jgi:hypothetical protein